VSGNTLPQRPPAGDTIRSEAPTAPASRIGLASGEWLEHAANLIGLAVGCRGIALPAGDPLDPSSGDAVFVVVAPGIDQSTAVFHGDTPECPEAAAKLPAGTRACAIVPLPRRNVDGMHWAIDGDIEIRALCATKRTWSDEEREALCTVVAFLADDLDIRHDLSLSRRSAEELRLHSLRDTLTGLPNRALFLDRLEHAVERAKRHKEFRFAVLSLDIDRFNAVNDSLGQAIGDEVLVAVARRLETCVRGEDTIGRLSGDEFVVLLESISNDSDGSRVAERMRRSLVEPILTSEGEVFVSASIGIVLSSSGGEDAARLVQQASIATSRAKAAGRDRYEMYDRAMHSKALKRLRTEMDLRHAVERGEFQLYYQPLVSLSTGRITELEALLRWHHPERGLVPPLDFIPLAEETGLIIPIGSWVLKEACRQMREWQREFPHTVGNDPLALSVNLSVKQLAQRGFVQHVAETIRASGLDPRSLKLEITESFVIDDPTGTRGMLEELRALGVKIYLDDFGTGYSSLAYLHTLPLDAIKIDRSFVTGMDAGPTQLQLVQTVRALAHNIGVVAVAEGVETEAQLKTLRALGCESAQGYLFSRPVTAAEITVLLHTDPRW
jgi:diguanylate cyclase (GGDEF)-like protein